MVLVVFQILELVVLITSLATDDVVTDCDRVPRRLCGRGCQVEGGQECHDKVSESQLPR